EQSGGKNWDGSVVELSQDGGTTWVDIGSLATANGYTGTVTTTGAPGDAGNNPLPGRQAFIGSIPAAVPTPLNLGTPEAGKTGNVRFRAATDEFDGNVGWEVDDIAFNGITNKPFAGSVPDAGLCKNKAPTAVAGPDQTVFEGATVQLAGSGTDPE